jgi:O-antigen ligase
VPSVEDTASNAVPGAVRVLALAGAVIVCAWPVRAFLAQPELPVALRAAWPAAFLAALLAPFASLLTFVACAPLVPIVPARLHWPPISLIEIWALALLGGAALRMAAGRRRGRGALPLAQPILLALATASLAGLLYPIVSLRGGLQPLMAALDELGRATVVAAPLDQLHAPVFAWGVMATGLALLWLIASEVGEDRGRAVRLLGAASIGAIAVALVGLDQWWFRRNLLESWVRGDPNIVRINATFSDPNGLGAFLALMLWVVLAFGEAATTATRRWMWRAGALLVASALVFTGSRAAWFAAAAAGCAGAVLLRRASTQRPSRTWRWSRRAVVLALAVVAAVVVLSSYATARNVRHADERTYLDALLSTFNLRVPLADRLKGRVPLWEAAGRMIQRHPVVGVGIGRYYAELPQYLPAEYFKTHPPDNAHSYFLQFGAELGIPGLACLLALIVAAMAAAHRAANRANDRRDRLLLLSAGLGVLAFTMTSITGHSLLLHEGQAPLWVVAGIALAAARLEPAGQPEGATPPWWRRWPRHRGWALAAVLAFIVFTVPLRLASAFERVDLAGVTLGVSGVATIEDGARWYWIAPHAVIYAPAPARAFIVPLRSAAPFPQRVRILVDFRLVTTLVLADRSPRTERVTLPPVTDPHQRWHRIELLIDPRWQPPDIPKRLGVQIGAYAWQ